MSYDIPHLPPLRPRSAKRRSNRASLLKACLLVCVGIGWALGLWDGEFWFSEDLVTQLEPLFFLGPLPGSKP